MFSESVPIRGLYLTQNAKQRGFKMQNEYKGYIGKTKDGEYIKVEKRDDGFFNVSGFYPVGSEQTADGCVYLSWSFYSGKTGPEYINEYINAEGFSELTDYDKEFIDGAYETDALHYCEECSTAHDISDSYNSTWLIVGECSVLCRECVEPADLIVPLNEPTDLFNAKDISGMSAPEGFSEIDCLFCDGSGFGAECEPALTKAQAEKRAAELIAEYSGDRLLCGITDIGQFQVYVTVYKAD